MSEAVESKTTKISESPEELPKLSLRVNQLIGHVQRFREFLETVTEVSETKLVEIGIRREKIERVLEEYDLIQSQMEFLNPSKSYYQERQEFEVVAIAETKLSTNINKDVAKSYCGRRIPHVEELREQYGDDDEFLPKKNVSEPDSDEDYISTKRKKGVLPKKKVSDEPDSDEDYMSTKREKEVDHNLKHLALYRVHVFIYGNGGSNYTMSVTLSPELAALVGEKSMTRHEVVKKIYQIIKEKDLYDPKDKYFAIYDEAMMKVFGVERFRTFNMLTYLKNHFIS